MSDTSDTDVGVLAVQAFVEPAPPFLIDATQVGGSGEAMDFVAETAYMQGPLAGLCAFGATVEKAVRHLAEQVWAAIVRDPAEHGEQLADPLDLISDPPVGLARDEVRTIRICTATVTRHPVTSVARTDVVLVVPCTVAFAAARVYAVVDEAIPALNGLAGSANTDKGAITDLVRRIRGKILSGALAPRIPPTWPGMLLLHRRRSYHYPVDQLARHSAA